MTRPILYSFRRCPYAMRARLAIASAGLEVELREVVLRDKPAQLIAASPKATVPVLIVGETVIDESRDIMDWALAHNDPDGWRNMPPEGEAWISQIEGPFKTALDRYKYATRYENVDVNIERAKAAQILWSINQHLTETPWIFGASPTLTDMATITFVRQFANTDRAWFDAQEWDGVKNWLTRFINSDQFNAIMAKYEKWRPESDIVIFG
ncbi:MAG: glutathione S-transferase [Celeribacter marinus]